MPYNGSSRYVKVSETPGRMLKSLKRQNKPVPCVAAVCHQEHAESSFPWWGSGEEGMEMEDMRYGSDYSLIERRKKKRKERKKALRNAITFFCLFL